MAPGPIDAIRPVQVSPGLGAVGPTPSLGVAPSGEGRPFGEYLADALSGVNKLQLDAERQSMLLATGQAPEVHQVMIAAEKAELALQLTIQLRNKALEAYQEIMRMQV